MLDAMRKNTKVILWITVVSFLALMVLVWGAEQSVGCGGAAQGVIGRVNGEPITVDYFNRVYQANRDNFRQGRGSEPGPGDEAMMLEQTWNSVVEQVLLIQEARRRGLDPTDEEVRNAALQTPPSIFTTNPNFQTNGQFDMQKYMSLIQGNPDFAYQLEAYLRDTLPVEKLQAMVYQAATVSDEEVRQAFLDRNETARITYRLFELRSQALPSPVTDQEAEAYFKANPAEFNLPSQATVRYVKLDRRPTDTDIADIRGQLVEYAGLARRWAAGDSTALSFAALAETYSDLPSAANGGLTDQFFGPGELTPTLEAALANLGPGDITEPFQEGNALQIAMVDSVRVDNEVRRVRIRQIQVAIEAGASTVAEYETRLATLKDGATAANFARKAQAAGLEVQSPPAFAENGFIRGLESVAGSVAWAFRAEVGAVSPVFPTNDAWFVMALDRRSEKGKPEFNDVVEVARQKATEAKQREMAREKANAFLAQARLSANWKSVAGADSNQVRTVGPFSRAAGLPGLGRDPEAVAAVFGHQAGEVVGPIDAQRGVMVLRIEERKSADETQFATQRAQLQTQLLGQRRTEVYQEWLENLKATAEIKDFRELYLRS
jgi:peptidyl-prolyl cis-trans isomerase D